MGQVVDVEGELWCMRRFWWEMWRGGSLRERTIAIERQMAIVGRVAEIDPRSRRGNQLPRESILDSVESVP